MLTAVAVALLTLLGAPSTSGSAPVPALLLLDGFSDSLSGHVKEYCKHKKYALMEAVSPYAFAMLRAQGADLPEQFRTPDAGLEQAWVESMLPDNSYLACVISESDAGVPTAERLSVALGLPSNGVSEHLRNKYLTNLRLRSAGLATANQYLGSDWPKMSASLLADEQISHGNGFRCVVKPYRGVASDGVYLCTSIQQAETAFHSLLDRPKYGGGRQEQVLVQECLEGDEFAVDTVSSAGITKVLAVWRYRKQPINGAPFVYQCSELVDGVDETGAALPVTEYCLRALEALKVEWGPTHTEIMVGEEPRMVEVNARWHAQDFCPIARACLGTDALVATIDAFLDPDKFDALPSLPQRRARYGMIVHLISVVEGRVLRVNHLDEIRALPSFLSMELSNSIGDSIVRTTDIRTDSGYVLLVHDSDEALQRDFKAVTDWQLTMFDVEVTTPDAPLPEAST